MDDDQLPAIQSVWEPPVKFENSYRKVGRKVAKETYLQDVEGVYHAIGGFQRFVATAHEFPRWFYSRYMTPGQLLPQDRQEVDLTVHIHPALQRSALDVPYEVMPTGEPVMAEGGISDGQLDQGRDQTSRGSASSTRSAGGREDTPEQDETSRSLVIAQDQADGQSSSYAEEDAPLIEAMRSK